MTKSPDDSGASSGEKKGSTSVWNSSSNLDEVRARPINSHLVSRSPERNEDERGIRWKDPDLRSSSTKVEPARNIKVRDYFSLPRRMTIASSHVRAAKDVHRDAPMGFGAREKIGSAGRLQITWAEPCGAKRTKKREGRKEGRTKSVSESKVRRRNEG